MGGGAEPALASNMLSSAAEDDMISGINIVLVSTVAVLLVLYLLRRRTRIVTSQVIESPSSDTQSGAQPTS